MAPREIGLIGHQLVALRPGAAMVSAAAFGAAMPDSMALWLPLMRGTLTNPAEQPSSARPGRVKFGSTASRLPEMARRRRQRGFAALQQFGDHRVMLGNAGTPYGIDDRVGVIQVDDEADDDLIVLKDDR